jgi:hypothetical protein
MGDAKRKREKLKREAEIRAIEKSYADAKNSKNSLSLRSKILLFIYVLFNIKAFIKWKKSEKAKKIKKGNA